MLHTSRRGTAWRGLEGDEIMDDRKDIIAKAARRILPILMLCYFAAFLDRVNIGFAALTMSKDLGFSATAFGFGAGIFFLGYVLCELPSNLILARRRPAVDRPHPDQLGYTVGRNRLRLGSFQLLHCQDSAGRCRSRVFPRHDLLSNALVSQSLSRPHVRDFQHCRATCLDDRRAGLQSGDRGPQRRRRTFWMAVDVLDRSVSGGHHGTGRALLPARLTKDSQLSNRRRAKLAGIEDRQ